MTINFNTVRKAAGSLTAAVAAMFVMSTLTPTPASAKTFTGLRPAMTIAGHFIPGPPILAPGPPVWVGPTQEVNPFTGDLIIHPGHWVPGPMIWVPGPPVWVPDVYIG